MRERRHGACLARALPGAIFLACALWHGAQATSGQDVAREELVLPSGARLTVVQTPGAQLASLGLYFPAGTARTPDQPALAYLAPRLFLGSRMESVADDSSLEDFLGESGWRVTEKSDLDGAGILLAGQADRLETVLRHCLSRLSHPDRWDEAEFARAWREHRQRLDAWAQNPETLLRARMAARQYGEHPYRCGLGQRDESPAPSPEALRAFMNEHYQAGAASILAAGPFDPEGFLADFMADFDALEGHAPAAPVLSGFEPGAGRIELEGEAAQIIVQFPGVPGAHADAPALALLAGVLQQLLQNDLAGDAQLARSASAYYDYTAAAPRPLEVQVRQFAPEDREQVEARLARILERLRAAEFSEYQVITAKDAIFQSMDAVAKKGPRGSDPDALLNWSWDTLRQSLHFARWRDSFEMRVLGTGKERIAAQARASLDLDRATFGLLMPAEGLD